jgi:hypothetical protein
MQMLEILNPKPNQKLCLVNFPIPLRNQFIKVPINVKIGSLLNQKYDLIACFCYSQSETIAFLRRVKFCQTPKTKIFLFTTVDLEKSKPFKKEVVQIGNFSIDYSKKTLVEKTNEYPVFMIKMEPQLSEN